MNSSAADQNSDPSEHAQSRIIEGAYLRDILDQPRALRSAIAALSDNPIPTDVARALASGKFRRVILTGMGSSLHALYPLHLALSRRSVMSLWVETAELLLGFDSTFQRDTLLVIVSQSGQSAEIVNLMRRAGEFGHVVAVTNNAESPLAKNSSTVLPIHSGPEATVSCKSYLNTLAVLHWLTAALLEENVSAALDQLRAVEHGVSAYLAHWREHVGELRRWVEGVESIFVTGRAESLATAGTGGLILKESTRRHAEGMSCAAFRHGPFEMAGPRVLVLVFEGSERAAALNRRLVEDINVAGGHAVLVTSDDASAKAVRIPETPASLRPMVEILTVQMLSLAVAARDGQEAGRFERATKITSIE